MTKEILETGKTADGRLDISIWKITQDGGTYYYTVGNESWGLVWVFKTLSATQRKFDWLCSRRAVVSFRR